MKRLTLIALLTAATLTTASADSMFPMGDMMTEMTDAMKEMKTEMTDAAKDMKNSAKDSADDMKDTAKEVKDDAQDATTDIKDNVKKVEKPSVTTSEDISTK